MPSPVKVGSLVRWSDAPIREWIDQGCPLGKLAAALRTLSRADYRPLAEMFTREQTQHTNPNAVCASW
jgi:hypothetical protein